MKALVLASGYYYPTARADVVAVSGPAIPILGDILRYTWRPSSGGSYGRRDAQDLRTVRSPQKFTKGFPKGLALRPSQLRASAAESP